MSQWIQTDKGIKNVFTGTYLAVDGDKVIVSDDPSSWSFVDESGGGLFKFVYPIFVVDLY